MNMIAFYILLAICFFAWILPGIVGMIRAKEMEDGGVAAPEASAAASPEESERPAGGGIFDQIKPYIGAKTHDLVTPDRPSYGSDFATPAELLGLRIAVKRFAIQERRRISALEIDGICREIEESV